MWTASLLLALTPAAPAFDDWDGLHSALAPLGDVNADGVPDFALAHRPRPFGMGEAATEDFPVVPQESVVWILSGADGAVLQTLTGRLEFGRRPVAVGDLDADGVTDLAIADRLGTNAMVAVEYTSSVPGSDELVTVTKLEPDPHAGAPRVRVFSGASGAVLATIHATEELRGFGTGLSGGQQLVGDATPDLLIGQAGCVWLVDGASFEPVRAYRLDARGALHTLAVDAWGVPELPAGVLAAKDWPSGKIKTSSAAKQQAFGHNVALLPDLDGDQLAEVALAGPRTGDAAVLGLESAEDLGTTQVTYVLFSDAARPPLRIDSQAWCVAAGHDLDGDGVGDLVTSSVNEQLAAWSAGARAQLWASSFRGGYLHAEGCSLAFTSDHDGDGIADLVTAANETWFDADDGRLTILSSVTGEQIRSYSLRRAPGDERPDPPAGYFGGLDAVPLGDLDGDGLEELVIQSPVLQELRVLNGADLAILWTLDVTSLPRP